MKQSVFDYIKIRLRVLGINIANTFNLETAYPAENWANILSTFMYVLSYLLFLGIIFGNVKTLAGYSRNDMLFFTFVGQTAFYTLYTWSYDNMDKLIDSVRKGEMDVLLSKPLPTLFYVSTRKISFVTLFRDAFIPMTMIALLINWSSLNIRPELIIIGVIIFACGQWCGHVMQFLLMLPVFWSGQSEALLGISYTISNPEIPLEGLSRVWRVLLTTLLPISLPVAGSVSVMLGKSNPLSMLALTLVITAIATYLRQIMWKKALATYNSASS